MSGSSASLKSAGASNVPDNFPAGLRVLVVDDDPTCLMILEKMLKKCNYEAIICNKAEIGLSLLRENKNVCDIVLSDVHMPDMDGFKLLEHIGLEMDIPVIMMSVDDNRSVMMKGVTHGACDYIIKPVRIEALRAIWQHVVRRQQKRKDFETLASANDVDQHPKALEDVDNTSSGNEGRKWKIGKRRKEDEDESEERDESCSSKKTRVVWSIELHQRFVAAVNKLGIDKSVPKKILELMNVPGITRENIASHLQKYRLYLKRLSEAQHSASIDISFMSTLDRSYDLRTLAARGQHPGQTLSPLQASVLDRLNGSRSSISTPIVDQRNTFSFGNPRFYGSPTNMEPTQFMSLNQSQQYPFIDVNNQLLMPIAGQGQGHSQSQSQLVFPNGTLAHGLGSNVSGGGIVPSYNLLNTSNQIRPDSGSTNMTFNDWLPYSSSNKMGPTVSFVVDDESGTHRNGTGDNQDDILTALLEQQQGVQENELKFDGYAFDDLPRAT